MSATHNLSFSFIVFLNLLFVVVGAPDQGKFTTVLTQGKEAVFVKTLYKDSTIKIKVVKKDECTPPNSVLNLRWLIRSSTCYTEYNGKNADSTGYLERPYIRRNPGGDGVYMINGHNGEEIDCSKQGIMLKDFSNETWIVYPDYEETTTTATTNPTNAPTRKKREETDTQPHEDEAGNPASAGKNETPAAQPAEGKSGKSENTEKTEPKTPSEEIKSGDKKDDSSSTSEKSDEDQKTPVTKSEDQAGKSGAVSVPKSSNHVVAKVDIEAPYIVIVFIDGAANFSYEVTVEMKSPKGFLSAHQYPLLTFYMIMCIVYVFYATAWLITSACNFRDLLRVQFWIGGVILLGMIEKAVFYSEYLSVNTTGESVPGAAKFAEVVSALKRALARMLVIIVSLGFGIVKPRLGPMLHRVIGVGMLYFILAVIEALVRTDSAVHDWNNTTLLFASIPLAVLDSVICWWIFMSLMQTMKTLRLRRNVVKLSLYRHFSNTIIFCILASFIMIFWSNRRDQCVSDWRELWVDDAFWHVLFSVILLVIMILWRPNINNQRYAFSPLIDGGDDEDVEEPMLGSGATESVKMRGLRTSEVQSSNKAEDDLKWIEENIPQTVADAALPAIMDSDEEVMTTKYEMSKME